MLSNTNDLKVGGSRDELTGLGDRSFLAARLPLEIEQCQLQEQPLSIIVADIDFFRVINENCSHTAGDLVLKHFGEMLNAAASASNGWAARYGGEEFMACLPGRGLEEAARIAEQLRQDLEASTIFYREIEIKLTASFGAATLIAGGRSPGGRSAGAHSADSQPGEAPAKTRTETAGVAGMMADVAGLMADLLADAEQKLAEAKRNGRNQVSF